MAKMMVCRCDEGGTVSVQGPDFGRAFGRGSFVDFDESVAPGHARTWGDELAGHADLFAPAEPAAEPKTQKQQRGRQAEAPASEPGQE